MKDIKLNTPFLKILYVVSWISFILFGFIILWVIALFLANYGKDTELDKPKKKGVLNRNYQKLIFWYGLIVGGVLIIELIIFGLIF